MKIKTAIIALLLSASALSAAAPNAWVKSMERAVNQYFQEDMGLPYESMNVMIYNLGDDTLAFEYRGKMVRAAANIRSAKDMYFNTIQGMTGGEWAEYRRHGYKYLKVKANGSSYTGRVQ